MLSYVGFLSRRAAIATSQWSSAWVLPAAVMSAAACIFEILILTGVGIGTGHAYHAIAYNSAWAAAGFAEVALLAALAYTLSFAARGEYKVDRILDGERGNARVLWTWCFAFVVLSAIGFLTKSTAIFSRGWLISFFVTGLITAIALNAVISRCFNAIAISGRLQRRRLMLVATQTELEKLERDIVDGVSRVSVSARVVIPADANADEIEQILSAAAANARVLNIEDVMISHTLSTPGVLDRCVSAFNMLPVAIHLTAGGLVSRFKDARVSRFGRSVSLSLTQEPLRSSEALVKRGLDVVASALALILLAPLFVLIAVAIRLESPGPAFFRQRRRGYNHVEFSIFKFRTMTTMDDGDHVPQATAGDARITRVGRFLRNTSLDELPQLINVLFGQMSLVGPRPHAVAHDRFFEALIPVYPRRLNVKPGITGWAQVNGFRGATQTQQAMVDRVEHDLYYIDNWSIALDLYILALTVLSSKSRKNAY